MGKRRLVMQVCSPWNAQALRHWCKPERHHDNKGSQFSKIDQDIIQITNYPITPGKWNRTRIGKIKILR